MMRDENGNGFYKLRPRTIGIIISLVLAAIAVGVTGTSVIRAAVQTESRVTASELRIVENYQNIKEVKEQLSGLKSGLDRANTNLEWLIEREKRR